MCPPRVSVVMPAYNAQSTVVQAVHSVLEQTMESIELIICDDCSTDGTWDVLSSVRDPRVRLIHNEQNIGPGRSRDRAIAVSKGSWIAVIDADDAWHPDRLSQLMWRAEAWGGHALVFDDLLICHDAEGGMVPWRALHGWRAFGSRGKVSREIALEEYIRSDRLLIKPIIPARFLRESGVRHSSRIFGEDAEFVLRLAAAGAQLRYWPEPLYYYRITPGSITAQLSDDAAMRRCLEACREMTNWPEPVIGAFDRKIEALRVNEALYAFSRDIRQGRWRRALSLIRQQPALLHVLPKRLVRRLHYHLHRLVSLRQSPIRMERRR
ncbi:MULTISPECIES: glycosyltransferase family 2 protein [unclassified Thioalkalivibrio]|nr:MULTISPECIES: glycosyltransferase family 2 protein [unclassified Thioalkalivibrio]